MRIIQITTNFNWIFLIRNTCKYLLWHFGWTTIWIILKTKKLKNFSLFKQNTSSCLSALLISKRTHGCQNIPLMTIELKLVLWILRVFQIDCLEWDWTYSYLSSIAFGQSEREVFFLLIVFSGKFPLHGWIEKLYCSNYHILNCSL